MGKNHLTVGDTRNTLEKSCTTKTTATTVAKTKNNFNNNLEKNIMHNPILKSASAMTPVSEITRTRKSMMATTTVAAVFVVQLFSNVFLVSPTVKWFLPINYYP